MRQHPLLALVFVTAAFAVVPAATASAAPRFGDYSANSFSSRTGKLRLEDAKSRQYATMLRDASRGKPNFAGHFILASRPDSRLLIVHGSRDEQGSGVHYYNFDGRRFSEIAQP